MSTEDFARNLLPISIEEEMRTSYLDYSMSVIIGRALPDVRDGLKPVHRRILTAMNNEGLASNRKFSKCAGVVGEVLKKLHPHGDSAVYDALVRMAQPWNLRYPLINGQGNFGSPDGDSAAAYRYTECKMQRTAEELLRDLDKETVTFSPNFDGTDVEPDVLPARFPNLLVNGSEGIAVGMATKIPPHNMTEVINATVTLIENPDATVEDLMEHIPGPDFPTGAQIYGRQGILDAYTTGRGRVVVRATTHMEEFGTQGRERTRIVVDELPFQVGANRVLEQIANLVRDKRIDGISAIRDESDRHGRRVVIECKMDAYPEVVLNKLFKHTDLQTTFGVILLAICAGQPQVLTLRQMLKYYISHRRDVVTRRTRYLLRKARERAHILEGYLKALDHIDEIISIIRGSQTTELARNALIERFNFSEIQSRNILDMQLRRLVGMERQKLEDELAELEERIAYYVELLSDDVKLMAVVREELIEVRDAFGDMRRTIIVDSRSDLNILDLIAEEEQAITLSMAGYIKRVSLDNYQDQRRGGFGKKGMNTRSEDIVREITIANTHASLLVFTKNGQVFRVPVHAIPEAGRHARGKPIAHLVELDKGDEIAAVLTIREFEEEMDLVFCSRKGLIKRTQLSLYKNIRTSGLRAYDCGDGDSLFTVVLAKPDQELLIATAWGKSIRFPGSDVRRMGRVARGVRGMKLADGDEIRGLEVLEADDTLLLLTLTENGYGKRTVLGEYRLQGRGGQGIINIKTGERNGAVVGSMQVQDEDRIMLITDTGRVIKIPVTNIRVTGRNTMGVTLMRVEDGERIVSIARVVEDEESEEGSSEE
ncbi:MAG: DNA gyrase subunit A [Cognaticolwellia sp.]|jgi:DNA gyrase subunit A